MAALRPGHQDEVTFVGQRLELDRPRAELDDRIAGPLGVAVSVAPAASAAAWARAGQHPADESEKPGQADA